MSTDSLSIKQEVRAWQQAEAPVRPRVDGRSVVSDTAASSARSEPANVNAAAERINVALLEAGRDLRFNVDDELGRVIVQVVHQSTGEVVRQIPTEEAVAIAQRLQAGEGMSSLGLHRWS